MGARVRACRRYVLQSVRLGLLYAVLGFVGQNVVIGLTGLASKQ
jgi:hypothetical protein